MQDDWDPDWQSTSSSKVTYLVRRLKALQEANSKVDCPTNDKNCSMDTEHLPSLPHMGDSKELIQVHGFRMSSKTHETNLDKVLVFSQFLEHIHVIEQQVTIVYCILYHFLALCDYLCTSDGFLQNSLSS